MSVQTVKSDRVEIGKAPTGFGFLVYLDARPLYLCDTEHEARRVKRCLELVPKMAADIV